MSQDAAVHPPSQIGSTLLLLLLLALVVLGIELTTPVVDDAALAGTIDELRRTLAHLPLR